MREITIKLYELDELSPDARARAIETLREKLGGDWWDSADDDDIRDVMVATLAEKLGTPGVHDFGVSDFPGIPFVTVDGWSLDQRQALAVSGGLERGNAPALPWTDEFDSVTLTSERSDGTRIDVNLSCTCPDDHVMCAGLERGDDTGPMEQAVRDALSAAWSAGEKEAEHKASEESAVAAAEGREFTEDGDLA